MKKPPSPETIRAVAAALGKARLLDDRFGNADEGRILAWAEIVDPHKLCEEYLLDGVTAYYSGNAGGRVMQPVDLVECARAVRRDEDARTGPTPEYQALCESKFATYDEALRQITQRTGQTVGREIGETS